MEWVLDASIALAWAFPEERTPFTESLFDKAGTELAGVPQSWGLEVANVLSLTMRKGRITAAKRAQFITTLSGLRIQVDPLTGQQAFRSILDLADDHQLTAYDAAYLELAMRLGIPLATLDQPLRQAAKKVGVTLL